LDDGVYSSIIVVFASSEEEAHLGSFVLFRNFGDVHFWTSPFFYCRYQLFAYSQNICMYNV